MFVYILLCDDGSTYVGATVNLERRIRQHNKELVGGAVATGTKVNKGLMWNMVCYVSGFPDWIATLQFEWRLKQLTRKINDKSLTPIERRYKALDTLLSMERSTTKAIPFSEWTEPPKITPTKKKNETNIL
jgi:structure-specific endonuclease subunit SLX1